MIRSFVRLFLTFLTVLGSCRCLSRKYYIAIREVDWNYAPSGQNLINGKQIHQDTHASIFLDRGPSRIGSVYKKAVYKQYTSDTFSTEVPKPDWLGFLGPVIRAEVGDDIVVHMKNFASRRYSVHPHGVFYEKDSEGALYPDGTSGRFKKDDAVAPGESYTYTWSVTEEFAPTNSDSNCLTWIYHSHVDAPRDIATGLIGVLLTCNKGVLETTGGQRSDVNKEFFLMFSVVDENLSWYIDENIRTFSPDAAIHKGDEEFQESNLMHSINGYVFGNLPQMNMCVGDIVSWHLFGIGNEVDIHSAYFHGHTLLDRGHRTDVLSLFPATFVTATMVPMTTGKWMLSCQVNDHMQAGMQGFYQVSMCGKGVPRVSPGHERRFYIATEEAIWDYGPSGINKFTNEPLDKEGSDAAEFFTKKDGRLGGKYWKVRYVAYSDDTFTTKHEQHGSEHHLGFLGPVIRGEPGDVIVITFRNMAAKNFSLQPHGLSYDKVYEGALYQDGKTYTSFGLHRPLWSSGVVHLTLPLSSSGLQKAGASVAPGQTFTYRWRVTEGPSNSDPPCLSYLYYSATDPVRDTNSGLVGPLQVCKKGVLDESGRQHIGSEVQKEFFLLFTVIDENQSWYLEENVDKFGSDESDLENPLFQESNKMHSVNGYMYGNLPGLDLCEGDHVVWHMLGLGTEVDLHGIYFQGNTFQREGTTHDTLSLFPHTSVTVSMKPDNNGVFGLSCRTTDHYRAGMRQFYTVKSCTQSQTTEITSFQPDVYFYLAAEEAVWNYAPNRTWEFEKHTSTLSESPGNVFLNKNENQIGPEYIKVVYHQYTDDTFTTKKTRGSDEEHLGILGPILRVEVGERVQVVFKNNAKRPYSVHAHGVKTSEQHLAPVSPGMVIMYNWTISSGPGRTDPNCITFAYYSSADFVKDLASGLVGPLVVCRKGTLDKDRRRTDVDKEFALLFMVFDENESWYLDKNIEKYLQKNPETFDKDEEGFVESNMMHGINGKLYANLHGLRMMQGDKTEWYLMGLGNEIDMHTVHFHAQSFIYKTDYAHRADVYDLFPGTFKTVELVAGTPGTWLLHCHVTDHIHAGMETTFTINAAKPATVTPGGKGSASFQSLPQMLLFITLVFWLQ
ncbi:hephaestin-like protein 1a isoform X2 [Hemibagrus wyckioides]|uniref:hephaestin-like protein 1a isoform X2 n=1 Tax=Hemibagrus wyckioides TaxID=337641 RepID=UPI00266D6C95|nr:hephaestin-like protein 1a isoform X2 [Hemibagrus wyckioides]